MLEGTKYKQVEILNVCLFGYTTFAVSRKVRIPFTGLTTPVGWLSLLQLTVLSVHNRCVIEVFGGVFVLSRCFLDFSVGVGAFVIGMSRISSFISWDEMS